MAKKYLSLEEAAAMLGVETGELNRLRESGEVRGFADRGTFKFRVDDIEELSRRRQADSDPDVPLMGDDDLASDESPEETEGEEGVELDEAASDSDVRLVLDEGLSQDAGGSDDSFTRDIGDSSPDVELEMEGDSDSDVRLAEDSSPESAPGGSPGSATDDSDSDVKLAEPSAQESETAPAETDADSDSDVTLAGEGSEPGSDSDVRLVTQEQSQSDSAPGDSPEAGSAESEEDDSGIALDSGSSPGAENASDSGIALEPPREQDQDEDSGIALDSGEDSGIALESPADSGISLDEDSGITLDSPADSGLALDSGDQSAPSGTGGATQDDDETQFDMATFGEDEEPAQRRSDDTDTDTSMMVFDDEESADDHAATVLQRSDDAADATDFDTVTDDEGPESSAELFTDDEFGDEFGGDDDLEVAADVLDEDEGLEELDVFEAGDEEFAEEFEAGETPADFGRPAAPAEERDWGAGVFAGLTASTLLLVVCGLVMFDLVRSMWAWHEPIGVNSWLIDTLSGLFGG